MSIALHCIIAQLFLTIRTAASRRRLVDGHSRPTTVGIFLYTEKMNILIHRKAKNNMAHTSACANIVSLAFVLSLFRREQLETRMKVGR